MVLETEPLTIDRILTSMQGPFHRSLVDSSALDWVTAVRMDVIDAETQQPMGGEFFCHSQLQLLNGTRRTGLVVIDHYLAPAIEAK